MPTEDIPITAARAEPVGMAASGQRGRFRRERRSLRMPTTVSARRHGYSMTELITVISIIGIIASIIVVQFPDLNSSGKNVLARERLELLNGALSTMNIAGRPINAAANLGSAADEQLIVMTLQMRDESLVGSPFVIPNYRPQASSDARDHRLRFNGVRFELLLPGQAGTGLKVAFDGSDIGPARVFPPNFRPYGS